MKCRHCGELGHRSQTRCKVNENSGSFEEAVEAAGSHGPGVAATGNQGDTWTGQAPGSTGNGWENETPSTVTASGW